MTTKTVTIPAHNISEPEQTFSFEIPDGAPGPQGPPGPIGPQGAQGPAGPAGASQGNNIVKPRGEDRLSYWNGDILGAMAEAKEKGLKLVIDQNIDMPDGVPLLVDQYWLEGLGWGDKAPWVHGTVYCTGNHTKVSNLKIDGKGKACYQSRDCWNQVADTLRLVGGNPAMLIETRGYYGNFQHIDAMINNVNGLCLSTPKTLLSDDNGQFHFKGCNWAGGGYVVARQPAEIATMHRITFERNQFNLYGSNADYSVDLRGIGSVLLKNCDTEGGLPKKAWIRVTAGAKIEGGILSMSVANAQGPSHAVEYCHDYDYGVSLATIEGLDFQYPTPNLTCIAPDSSLICKWNHVGMFNVPEANQPTIHLYGDPSKYCWIEDYDLGLWYRGTKRF